MYKAILFDLDGTLTESGEGITKSVQYALEKMGKPEPDLKKLECFIGPPLVEMFQSYAGMTEEEARRATEIYRERFRPIGIFENQPYPGVPEMLQELKQKGYLLGVASSKPEEFVRIILDHFQLTSCFDEITGSEMHGQRNTKSQVIEEALRRMKLSDDRAAVILVGDKEHDVLGARECGLECLAVSYGYGTPEELQAAAPLQIIDSVEGIIQFFDENAAEA